MPSPRASTSGVLNSSKKGYSLKEKYNILQYIIEHNSYGEVKGRSFWVNMEKSRITARTWQSLKEVFLKRILPDLRNPYYKLTQEQIRAFSLRSAFVPKPKTTTTLAEKNKAMDRVLNRSTNDQSHSSPSNTPEKTTNENKQSTRRHSPRKINNPTRQSDSDIEIVSSNDGSPLTAENQTAVPNDNEVLEQNNRRSTRNTDKENSLKVFGSQESHPIESFPMNELLTSTPRKSLLRSSNLNSAQKNTTPSNKLPSPSKNTKTQVVESAKMKDINQKAVRNNEAGISKQNDSKQSNPINAEKRSFSPNILLLSSHDTSLSDDEEPTNNPENKSKRNLFGFSTGKPNTSANQQVGLSSDTEMSSEIPFNVGKPSTSNYISPSRPNKLVGRQRSFVEQATSSDQEENSSDSQYTYYRSSDVENVKRKGKKMYGLLRGKLVPLYAQKKSCCVERKELIAKGKITKKLKQSKHSVYIDHDVNPVNGQKRNAINGRLNEKGRNALSGEVLNFWKLKYLLLKRRNDEIIRLLAKQSNEPYIDSVTKMLSSPLNIPDKVQDQQTRNVDSNNLPSSMVNNNNNLSPSPLAKGRKFLNPEAVKHGGEGHKFIIASTRSRNEPSTSRKIAENDNVVVIDSQKADIIIDILRKVSEMKQSIDPTKVNSLIPSPKTKSILPPKQPVETDSLNLSPFKTRAAVKQMESPSNREVIKQTEQRSNTRSKNPKAEKSIAVGIMKLREKEKEIFKKIESENIIESSNINRDIFSKSELELLFNENDMDKSSKNRDKNSSTDSKKENIPAKKLKLNEKTNVPDHQLQSKPIASTSKYSALAVTTEATNSKLEGQPSKNNQQSHKESFTEDTNKTNYLPESMDVEDNVKFAINPKFFSILFPNESKEKESKGNVKDFDESTRYSLPKSLSVQPKKNKKRRSPGKVIKLKMFANVKKDKRQSLDGKSSS